jgi:hypothetical protein
MAVRKKNHKKRIQIADMKYLCGAAGYKHADQHNTEIMEKLNFLYKYKITEISSYKFS